LHLLAGDSPPTAPADSLAGAVFGGEIQIEKLPKYLDLELFVSWLRVFPVSISLCGGNTIDDSGAIVGHEQGTIGRDGYAHGTAIDILAIRVGHQSG
jgi:hypothetical protein